MSYLLDTNICSAHLKRPSGLIHRFIQHSGRLYLPTIVLGELYAWAYRRNDPAILIQQIEQELLADLIVLDFDSACAETFGRERGLLLKKGISVNTTDLMIASVALTHNLTLVTHNTKDFLHLLQLRLENWLVP